MVEDINSAPPSSTCNTVQPSLASSASSPSSLSPSASSSSVSLSPTQRQSHKRPQHHEHRQSHRNDDHHRQQQQQNQQPLSDEPQSHRQQTRQHQINPQQQPEQQQQQQQQRHEQERQPQLTPATPVHYSYPPPTRFQLAFPLAFEQWFAPFDDFLLAFCQRNTTGLVHMLSFSLTFFTSIEISLATPATLYALGYDTAAALCASVLLMLGIVSQIPKKFIHRPRPWMVARALPIRRDTTSSFPSRAVACSVVFSWLIATSLHLEGALGGDGAPLDRTALWAAIIVVALFTSFARINVGAHYPSDTILGFCLGCLVLALGSRVEQLWRNTCAAYQLSPGFSSHTSLSPSSSAFIASSVSSASSTPASSPSSMMLANHNNNNNIESTIINTTSTLAAAVASGNVPILTSWLQVARLSAYRPFFAITFVSYAMTLISIQGFWVKCSYVYGLLMASAAFRTTYMCSSTAATVAPVVSHGSFGTHVRAALTFGLLLFFGMATKGKKGMFRIFSFTLIYFGSFFGILYWRLRPQDTPLG